MPSRDELVAMILGGDFLLHEYDAQKAHEYYLRTRDLKGRSRGMDGDGSTTRMPAAQPKKSTPISKAPAKKTAVRKPAAPKETIEQRRARIKAATEQLKAKLEQLREVLRQLVNEAKIRNGGEATPTGGTTPESGKGEAQKELTPAEKAEQAKKAHEYYEKHKQETPEQSIAQLQEKIKQVEAKIAEKRAQIAKRKAVAVGAEPTKQ